MTAGYNSAVDDRGERGSMRQPENSNDAKPIEAPTHSVPIPFIRAAGTHREIGQQIGSAARDQIQHSIMSARNLIEQTYNTLELDWDGALIQARKYLPFAQERYPQYVEEIIGMAEGAGVTFNDLTVLNAMEAVTIDALHLA